METRRGSFKDGRHKCLFEDIRICNHIPLSHGYPTSPLYLFPLSFTDFSSFSSFICVWGCGAGILDRFSGNDGLFRSFPILLIVVVFCNVCVLPPSPLCPLFCSAALPRCCTSSHTVTALQSGLSLSIRTPLCSPCYGHFTVLLTSCRPHQPLLSVRYEYMVRYMLMFFPLFFRVPPLYAPLCLLAFQSCLSFTITILSLLSFFVVTAIGCRRGIIVTTIWCRKYFRAYIIYP